MILLPFTWPLFLRELSSFLSIWPHDSHSLLRLGDYILLWPGCSGPFPKGIRSRKNLATAYQPNYHKFEKPTFILALVSHSTHGIRTMPITQSLAKQWWSNGEHNSSDHSTFCGHISASCSQGFSPEESLGLCS